MYCYNISGLSVVICLYMKTKNGFLHKMLTHKQGFTLMELLVTIGIIAILSAISLFAIADSRKSARDGKRKADLETVRTALELYRADCNEYPANGSVPSLSTLNLSLNSGTVPPCTALNIRYLERIPKDPATNTTYRYVRLVGNVRYALCARLEEAPSPAMTATDCTTAGLCPGGACNYIVYNP